MSNIATKNYYLVLQGFERLKEKIPVKVVFKALYDKVNTTLFKRT